MLAFLLQMIIPLYGLSQVIKHNFPDTPQVKKNTRNLPGGETVKKDSRDLPAEETVKFELPAHTPTKFYTMSGSGFTEMKKQFVDLLPLQISGIDASLWENDPHTITVYFTMKNKGVNAVSGYVEAAIGDEDNPETSFPVSRLQPNAEITGSISIHNAPPICYDNFLQITFFEVDTLGKIAEQPGDLDTKFKNPYNITVTQQSADVSHLNFNKVTTDNDHDFLDDKLEDALLEKYSPYFNFSLQDGTEPYRPCDAYWYIQNSLLAFDYENGSVNTDNCPLPEGLDQSCLASDPNCLLTFSGKNFSPPDLMQYAGRTNFHLIPSGLAKQGNSWDDILSGKNIGLYGHVVPVILNTPADYETRKIFPCTGSTNPRLYYKVEYWQYFGYNYDHQHIGGRDYGDHEGDWATVQLLVDAQAGTVASLFYYAHGLETRFEFNTSVKADTIQLTDGASVIRYNGVNASEYPDDDIASGGAGHDSRNNRTVYLYEAANGFSYTHPFVFIENGSHEFWPTKNEKYGVTKVGKRYFAPFHNGEDHAHSYLTAAPPNLGELEHPLDETPGANVILRYSGFWGCYNVYNSNPPGPTLHTEWTYPFDSKLFNSYNFDLEP